MSADARALDAADMRVGLEAVFERELSADDVLDFARVSGDENPLHVDEGYAAGTNYRRRIAHGAFQVGLASAMAGMFLPGRNVLLMSVQARFPQPLFFPARVRVRGTVTSWSEETQKGVLKVVVEEARSSAATAEVFLGFTFHDRAAPAPVRRLETAARPRDTAAPLVVVTGAAGGLGGRLASALAERFHVVALTNQRPLDESLRGVPTLTELPLSLSRPDWERQLDDWREGRPIFGIVHAAWPGAPQGGLLTVSSEVLEQQLHFGATLTVRLARYLAASVGDEGRLVLIGSTYGTVKPSLALGAYSLGKALLEQTVRLLAPELGRKRITVNVVSPSVVPTGMNAHLNERQRLREVAHIPVGRLCEPDDVVGAVEFLLSERAAFVSGQSLALTGGQL